MSRTVISLGRLELVWRTENVLHRIQSEFSRKERPTIYDPASNWYEAWYFALRLDEEIIRSRRYSHAMALVALTFDELGPRISPRRVELKSALAQVIQTKLRQTDIPGVIDQDEFAVCLPQTDGPGAGVVVERLAQALAIYRPSFGVDVYPVDGVESGALLRAAFANRITAILPEEDESLERSGEEWLLER